ncbi:4-amino-4-deoxy-L-arabinose-phospho-UDP flippase [Pantoea sp. Bo_2]|uniref:Probable 4-amino-4-deoxy-L-arabinose-phosphoundecaprenol flippase subunit ArnF n=1 Tax=Candidatus Pantoea gossypiicola TaxID=2608008 RepID=A0AB34CGQ9_9GAMM|nr:MULTISPECIES: 4-amino-4-deoxy-L-arabinose-phosphoundecaprenol flippase subunit ArnF [Pantoea]KAA5927415.1 4-amino-4-deoxy-L-arabinose-phospho-UDP flippase [Pantoea sp. VH_8]KAA5931754.1 4-amino-4-deoxy-L-arabinose-phospho-UDP flippase [Pantoea sp. VH_4]KAA5937100.1 4-amino-4-deoxy-L-arabinose-phospho-UDP flippase [Pantoea sp. VH_3]KAA5945921.1 4-amino-4-deoxy-L-arabinose-phospho-UDP flippase [Pantoea sp. VH_25]KAA5953000.1 4-amino-4-deoxy-L-arabinose-phospho-UDP flippase [Pantoea sp. VH_24]
MKGYGWVACSVLLVSAAQLMMRWAMPRLPDVSSIFSLPTIAIQPALLLFSGLAAYGISMLCWIRALHYFPLNRVYPLLSLSYVLVWLVAVCAPVFHEAFSWHSLAGVVIIVTGLLCIVIKP